MRLIPSRTLSWLLLVTLAPGVSIWSAAEGPPELPPNELVKCVVANEIKSENQTAKYMFRQRKETPSGSQTKLLVETRDAIVGVVVANNDRPLNPDERQGEYGRIQRFLDDPAE